MKVQELASKIAHKEGHKSQARIGDVREIIGIISDLTYESKEVVPLLISLGIARAKRKKSKK